MFERHFGQGQDTGNIEVLVSAAEEAGLDARALLRLVHLRLSGQPPSAPIHATC